MAIKSKIKSKVKSKVKPKAKPKASVKKATAKFKAVKPKIKIKPKVKLKVKSKVKTPVKKAAVKFKPVKKPIAANPKASPINKKVDDLKIPVKAVAVKTPAKSVLAAAKRINPLLERRRPIKKRLQRGNQFNFMKAPSMEYAFEVGDTVEVFCDHEKNKDRIRGWVKGIVVQVDHKLAAVQFRSNVYLTDGWMVPDRILWFPTNSEHIRPVAGKKPVEKRDFILDY